MALSDPTNLKRIDPAESFDGGNSELEKLVTKVFWTVMASGAVYYPFYAWAMVNQENKAEIFFSYNGADYTDNVTEVKPDSDYKVIAAKMIDKVREYQG